MTSHPPSVWTEIDAFCMQEDLTLTALSVILKMSGKVFLP